ncbi:MULTISPECIES: lysis system i-spanin subunit Rz [Proteus]|uniref:Lysis protein n=1 Tax=Proteus penneri TaxID=102862 RepID=A0ABS0W2P5_9GAMM|nr:lysis protein [Proteus penneri]NBN26146.1 lysis protein [Proteus sp. G2657]SUC00227.1 phage endopeptidase [Proteus penneri]
MSKYIPWFFLLLLSALLMALSLSNAKIKKLSNENELLSKNLSEQININGDYKERIERLNQLDTRHTQELVNAKNEISRLRDISEHHPERVYIKAECPKVTTTPSTSLAYATTARPTDTAIRNYWLLRERIAESEKIIRGLQDYVRQECAK